MEESKKKKEKPIEEEDIYTAFEGAGMQEFVGQEKAAERQAKADERKRIRQEQVDERAQIRQDKADEAARKRAAKEEGSLKTTEERRYEKTLGAREAKLRAAGEGAKVIGGGIKTRLAEARAEPKAIPKQIGGDIKAGSKAAGKAAVRAAGRGAIETYKRAPEIGYGAGEAGVSAFRAIFSGMRRQPIGKIRKPVHPDKLIKNKELYGFGGAAASRMTPLGRPMTDWRELYFGQKPIQKDSSEVLNALMHGAEDIEAIKVYTGIDSDSRINSALNFLQRQGKDTQYLEEG